MQEKLHYIHIFCLIYMLQLDVTIFSFPRVVVENAGTNGWIFVIVLSLFVLLHIGLIYFVYRFGQGRSIFEILEASIPKVILTPFYVILALFWIALASLICKNYVLIYQTFTFQNTPPYIYFILLVLLVYFLLTKGIYNIAKAATIFFIVSIWITLLLIYFIPDLEFVRLTRFFFKGQAANFTMERIAEVNTIFMGYELVLFLFPFVNIKSKLFKGVIIGHLLYSSIILIVVIVAMMFFSFAELQGIIYPIYDMLSFLEFPFISRTESLIYTFFLFSNLISSVMYAFAASLTLKRLVPNVKPKRLYIGIMLTFLVIGLLPKVVRQVEYYLREAFFLQMYIAIILTFILLLLIWIQHRKGRKINNAH